MTVDAFDPPSEAEPLLEGGMRGTFFGEPRALAFLAFTEAWERFSYYGMTAILVLYMSQALFLPGRIETIAGFAALRSALEGLFGPMTTLALASQVFGLYTGFVYFTPVFGGWLADRFIGRRRAVMAGAMLMSAGHLAMAFDASFLVALLLLITGCGLLKGNISTQVGTLYPVDDSEGRTRAFSIFSTAINVGAIAGPLLIGILADRYSWHLGFGTAGVLMLFGLATYAAGYKYLPEDEPRRRPPAERAPLSPHDGRIVAALLLTMALTIFQSLAYYQNTNIALVWIDRSVDLTLLGFKVPVAWFNSIDPAASIAFVPILFAWWDWQARHGRRGELAKIATGAWIACGANLILAIVSLTAGHARVSVIFPILYDVLLGVAFLYYWPTLLALVSRSAPPRINATMMGCCFLSIFIANSLIGWLGSFYEVMTPASFWALHAAIAATGAVIATLLRRPLSRVLEPHRD
ncbi:MAG: peptide MFS transporter [Sphingomonadales bacterium]